MANIKSKIRAEMLHHRQQLSADQIATSSWQISNNLRQLIAKLNPEIIAMYYPLTGEPNLLNLAQDLHNQGVQLALPRVVAANQPMVFNIWNPNDKLTLGYHNIPVSNGAEVTPSLIIMPCLSFSKNGLRLGFGGGFYDRTLAKMPAFTKSCITAFVAQQNNEIPHEKHDICADFIVTEEEVLNC